MIDEPQAIGAGLGQIDVVGDEQHRALIAVDGVDQSLAAVDVQVRGRFVEYEDMRFGVGHEPQQQPHLLAAGEVLYFCVDLLLAKAHAGGKRAQLGRSPIGFEVAYVLKHGFAFAQFVELILAEIAHLGFAGSDALAGEQRQTRGD